MKFLKIDSLDKNLRNKIEDHVLEYEKPKRKPMSLVFPVLAPVFLFARQSIRSAKNVKNKTLAKNKSDIFLPNVLVRHQSPLERKLGKADPKFTEAKRKNIELAIEKLNGIKILPGENFSFWHIVGKPKKSNGYRDGMLLSNGEIIEGLGGGMCQLSNLLYWLFLHSPVEITERHHHSHDPFPDSGRTLPFGSGATILYNHIDLGIKNTSKQELQIKLFLDDKYLKGRILSNKKANCKIHVYEKSHYFIKKGNQYFRYNEVWKDWKKDGKIVKTEKVIENFAPVIYKVTGKYIEEHGFEVIELK